MKKNKKKTFFFLSLIDANLALIKLDLEFISVNVVQFLYIYFI